MIGSGANDDERTVPDEIATRARRRRARLTVDSVELMNRDDIGSVDSGTDIVLLVGVLPAGQRNAERFLSDLRSRLAPSAHVWILDTTSPTDRSRVRRAGRALRRMRGADTVDPDRRTVEAVRSVGWTVTSVERFVVGDGTEACGWVDLSATTIGPESPVR